MLRFSIVTFKSLTFFSSSWLFTSSSVLICLRRSISLLLLAIPSPLVAISLAFLSANKSSKVSKQKVFVKLPKMTKNCNLLLRLVLQVSKMLDDPFKNTLEGFCRVSDRENRV